MLNRSDRSNCDKNSDLIREFRPHGQSGEHLSGSLGVSNVVQILVARGFEYEVDLSGEVVFGHVLPCEVPEDRVLFGVERGRVGAVHVTTVVSEPDVVP